MISMEIARVFFFCCLAVFIVVCLDDTRKR